MVLLCASSKHRLLVLGRWLHARPPHKTTLQSNKSKCFVFHLSVSLPLLRQWEAVFRHPQRGNRRFFTTRERNRVQWANQKKCGVTIEAYDAVLWMLSERAGRSGVVANRVSKTHTGYNPKSSVASSATRTQPPCPVSERTTINLQLQPHWKDFNSIYSVFQS